MFELFSCYLSGRHEYVVGCEPGTIFLRCMHCGKRSTGWQVEDHAQRPTTAHDQVVGLTARARGDNNTGRAGSPHFQRRSEAAAR